MKKFVLTAIAPIFFVVSCDQQDNEPDAANSSSSLEAQAYVPTEEERFEEFQKAINNALLDAKEKFREAHLAYQLSAYGLDEHSTIEDLEAHQVSRAGDIVIKDLGLPDDTSPFEVLKYDTDSLIAYIDKNNIDVQQFMTDFEIPHHTDVSHSTLLGAVAYHITTFKDLDQARIMQEAELHAEDIMKKVLDGMIFEITKEYPEFRNNPSRTPSPLLDQQGLDR